jgi:RNA polymerase sigma-32 factor
MSAIKLPVLLDNNLSSYIAQVNKFPILEEKEELRLARQYLEHNDLAAAHTLVTSHLRLVVKIAMGFRGYGLPIADIISEGNIGLMQAVKKFDPEKGFRLSTYAMWWIKASIHEFVLRSWTIVKVGTSAVHKKLFFNLKRMKNRIAGVDAGYLNHTDAVKVAKELNVNVSEVIEMDRLMTSPDTSLNTNAYEDGEDSLLDLVEDASANQETVFGESQELGQNTALLHDAMDTLNDREKEILSARRLQEDATTLEDLSQKYGISRERVRQIENRAIEKIKTHMMSAIKGGVSKVAAKVRKAA